MLLLVLQDRGVLPAGVIEGGGEHTDFLLHAVELGLLDEVDVVVEGFLLFRAHDGGGVVGLVFLVRTLLIFGF